MTKGHEKVGHQNNRPMSAEEAIARFRPIDDLFFSAMYADKETCQELLRTILDDDQLIVVSVTMQSWVNNLVGRSVRLDAYCKFSDGRYANVEVQRSNNDDHYRRMRYNASLITAEHTSKGTDFKDVVDVISIYITEFTLIEGSKTLYHVDSVVRETGALIDDGFSRMIVQAGRDDGTKIARLMKHFLETDFEDKEFPESSKAIKRLKHTEKGKSTMCELMEKYMEPRIKEAEQKGAQEAVQKNLDSLVTALRTEHPGWSEKQVEETARKYLGL